MHRLIVTSATYRQSSKARPDLQTLDPRNRLLARQSRLRLDAEVVRDVALASSGLLTRTIGGPSVFPPQPKGVYNFTQVPRDWRASVGPDRYRRGMYTWFWRSAPHPGLVVFDAPDAGTTCTRRNRSNTPLQALTLLNDESYLEFARRFGGPGAVGSQRRGGKSRPCVPALSGASAQRREQELLSGLLKKQTEAFRDHPEDAAALRPLKPHAGCGCQPVRGLDHGGPGAAQPRRVHHARVVFPRSHAERGDEVKLEGSST